MPNTTFSRRRLGALAVCFSLLIVPAGAARDTGGTAAPTGEARVLVVGDSLAVGMRPYLDELLEFSQVTWDARSGRTTPEGMTRLRSQLRKVTPQTVVVSLGTNDGSDPRRFTSRLRRTLAAIPRDACIVWADIYRPARKGAYQALNRVLRGEVRRDRRLTVIGWEQAVLGRTVVLPDGLHPDTAGYAHRSRMFASAVERGC